MRRPEISEALTALGASLAGEHPGDIAVAERAQQALWDVPKGGAMIAFSAKEMELLWVALGNGVEGVLQPSSGFRSDERKAGRQPNRRSWKNRRTAFLMMRVQGCDLKVGDTIEVWWSSAQERARKPPRQDTIIGLRPYEGPLRHVFGNHGAQIAKFQFLSVGMTIANGDYYKLINRSA